MQKRAHSVGVGETWTSRYPQANCEGTPPPDIKEQRAGFFHDTQSLCVCVSVCVYKHTYIYIYIWNGFLQ